MRSSGEFLASFLRLALPACAVGLAVPQTSDAAAWRTEKTVEIVVPSAAGSGTDRTARLVQRLLSEKKLIESPATVVNKPGGGTNIGMIYLNQHAGDGHYFAVISSALLTTFIMGRGATNYTETTPLAVLGTEPVVFGVRADSAIKSARDLAERLKANPAGISVALANALGNHNHVAIARVAQGVGSNAKSLRVVVFNGSGDVVSALLGGHVDLAVSSTSALVEHYRSGKVRLLAVSAEQRMGDAMAAVPTWKETGIAAVTTNWRGVVAPRGVGENQVRFWDEAFSRMAKLPEWKQELDARMVENVYLNSAETRKLLESEFTDYRAVMTETGLAGGATPRER